MKMTYRFAMRIGIVLLIACLGCGQKRVSRREGGKSLSGPVEIAWNNEYEFSVKGEPSMKGHVMLDKRFLKVMLQNFPRGTTLELGSATGIVGDYGSGTLELDVSDKIGALAVDLGEAKLDPGMPLVLKPANQPPVTVKLMPVRVSFQIDDLLKKAENGPLLFGKEAPHEGPPRSIMVVNYSHPLFGTATTLADVDALAFEKLLPDAKGTKVCGGYSSGGKKMPDLTVLLKETEVTVIDRRTGSVFKKNTFPPDTGCPMFVMTRPGENAVDSSRPAQPIDDWLRSLVRK
jgi:hypothetical protein